MLIRTINILHSIHVLQTIQNEEKKIFFVLHFRKVKTESGCFNVLKHNLRKKDDFEVYFNADKSHLNSYSGATDEDFSAKYDEMVSNLPRKIQINASRMIEAAVSFSHEYCEDWEKDNEQKKKIDEYFDTSEKFLKERFGDVIISRADHYDELTPHSHFLLVPIVTKDGKRKFSSSDFLGGRKGLFDLHDQFHLKVGSRFGLQRGVRESRTAHSDLKNYKEWEKSQRIIHEKKEAELEEQSNLLRKQQEEIECDNGMIKTQKKKLKQMELEIKKQENMLRKKQKEIEQNMEENKFLKSKLFQRMGDVMKKSVNFANREREDKELEKAQGEEIPQIPIPPRAAVTLNARKEWRDAVQDTVNAAFNKVMDTMFSFKAKYDALIEKFLNLNEQNENNKKRADKAESDLLKKPIGEIIAARKAKHDNEQVKDKNDERGVR